MQKEEIHFPFRQSHRKRRMELGHRTVPFDLIIYSHNRIIDNLDAYIKFVVYDKHLFYNAYKGEIRLNVLDFATNKEVTSWYPLRTNPKKSSNFTITGELQLSLFFKVPSLSRLFSYF